MSDTKEDEDKHMMGWLGTASHEKVVSDLRVEYARRERLKRREAQR